MDNPEKLATYGTQDEEKQKHSTICVRHHYTQTNTNKVDKTCAFLQTTEGKEELNLDLKIMSTDLKCIQNITLYFQVAW
jgi:hypothetical protein